MKIRVISGQLSGKELDVAWIETTCGELLMPNEVVVEPVLVHALIEDLRERDAMADLLSSVAAARKLGY